MSLSIPRKTYADLYGPTAGDRVRFRLSVKGGRSWVDRVEVVSASPVDAGLQQTPATPVLVPVGTAMPDFELVDQSAQRVALSSLRGKVVAVTFIYSRCPLPDYCPLMSANFAELNGALASDAELGKKAHLLSVTLDPEYDTPELLRRYGATYAGGHFDTWDFATGDPANVRRFAEFFGRFLGASQEAEPGTAADGGGT